jgi:excisionase family DNA binding protein
MTNPFEILDKRLENIEMMLLNLKHKEPQQQLKSDVTFSIFELANYLKVTKATIHAYKNRKVFPYYQTGRTVFFKKSEVDAALEIDGKKKGFKNG